jgi:exopolysaccharide biosynthesis polyprenyl glycosylphosphotransferase
MTDRVQFDGFPMQFASVAGVSRAPVRDTRPSFDGPAGPDWLGPDAPRGGRAQNAAGWHLRSGLWVQVAYVFIDVLCVAFNGLAAFHLRFSVSYALHFLEPARAPFDPSASLDSYKAFLFIYAALILLSCQWQSLYRTLRTRTPREESEAVLKAVAIATLLLAAFIYLSGVKVVSRFVVAVSMLLNASSMVVWRYAKRRMVIRRVEAGIGARNVVIVGAGRVGQALARQFLEDKHLGYRFRGFVDENHIDDPSILGKVEDLPRITRAEFIDEVFITIPSERELVKRISLEARERRFDVRVIPELYDGLGWRAPIHHVGEFPVMDLHWQPIPAVGLAVKRVLDVILSLAGLIATAPLLALLAAWIPLDSKGAALYRSKRVGRKGRVFTCYKFRTMVLEADALKDSLRPQNERCGPLFKMTDDPRVTRLGKFLRKYSLDELPQLWNSLTGDMSLVGPRPHPLDDFEQYDLDHLRRLEVKPGITGLWQVEARQNPSFEINMRLDLEYIERWNLWFDLKILALTLPTLLKGTGR